MARCSRIALSLIFLTTIAAVPCLAAERLFVRSHPAMGTIFTIYVYAADSEHADADCNAAFDEIDRIEDALSNYRDTSELSRVNREAAATEVTVDPEVFALLRTALHYSELSDGAFDVTVGPLMRAWGFFRGQGKFPTKGELARAREDVSWRNVRLNEATRTVRFARAGVELDLGGIGKGYAVDRVAGLLRDAGINAALIDAGSSTLYAIGAPPGRPGWRVRVGLPKARTGGVRSTAARPTLSAVMLRDESLSTSGSYEKFFRLNGRVYCHIMDPRTGRPVEGMLQTSVIAPDATTTDALSTTFFVLGPGRARAMLAKMPNFSAFWITGSANAPRLAKWHWRGTGCSRPAAGCGAALQVATISTSPSRGKK
jgi:FAD:protein FMN transferase